jgi:hypothetical protein
MAPRILTTIILFAIVLVVSFSGWHLLLSIYEVKFNFSDKENNLIRNSEYSIKCVGLNSLGWEIRYRDLECSYQFEEGQDLVEILSTEDSNHLIFKTKGKGSLTILANSKYALNPTKFKYSVIE